MKTYIIYNPKLNAYAATDIDWKTFVSNDQVKQDSRSILLASEEQAREVLAEWDSVGCDISGLTVISLWS